MNIREQVKELWRLCFNDSEAFTNLYFRYRYSEEVNLFLQEGEQVISALQLLPYPLTLWGNIVPTAYVSGACTHPDHQGKGAMKELLTRSYLRMYEQQIPVSTLIPAEPWLFNYYSRMGYAPVFHYTVRHYPISRFTPSEGLTIKEHTRYNQKAYDYLNRKMQERPCCLQHTEEDFRVILADLDLTKGSVLCSYREDTITGIAIVVPEGEELQVKELLTNDEPSASHLLHQAAMLYHSRTLSVTTPLVQEQAPKMILGMARIINAFTFLSLYAEKHPQEEKIIRLADKDIPLNEGYYQIKNGRCTHSPEFTGTTDREMNIMELTQEFLESENPYMSLMLN